MWFAFVQKDAAAEVQDSSDVGSRQWAGRVHAVDTERELALRHPSQEAQGEDRPGGTATVGAADTDVGYSGASPGRTGLVVEVEAVVGVVGAPASCPWVEAAATSSPSWT